jgi:amino acid adenylation domain-containing protein
MVLTHPTGKGSLAAAPECVHDLFEAQAQRSSTETAVRFCGETLTYAELDVAANRVAHDLAALGVGPDSIVAIDLERSPELVIGMLGILKAGAAYMPLGSDLPQERVRLMISDAQPRAVIGCAASVARRAAPAVPLVQVDRYDAANPLDPRPPATPANLAYLLYTSGSTGRPKGVAYPHRGAVNRLAWLQHTYPLAPGDRVLQKTPFGFDVSFWEFFWPLAVGNALVLAEPGGHRDPHYLADLIERERVSVVHFVPSMLQAFLEVDGLETRCRSLRWVFSSGETLSPRLEARFFVRLRAGLHNQYGPTESGECSFWPCNPEQRRAFTPIGRAIPGFCLHVLDECLCPVAAGETGELFIGGEVGLARGYFGLPALTAERFLPDPFGPPGARMYRTGDLVREVPEAGLEFLGRIDHQVKIRGHRIELGEIEAVLAGVPGVHDAVVVARQSRARGPELVAYLLAHESLTEAEVRRQAAEKLPAMMMPAALVFLAELPVTPNGKLDRARLPDPGLTGGDLLAEASDLERAVAELWAAVMGRVPKSVDEDFFAAGGDSLRALQLIGRLRDRTDLDLTLADFTRVRTVRSLANILEEKFSRQEVGHA